MLRSLLKAPTPVTAEHGSRKCYSGRRYWTVSSFLLPTINFLSDRPTRNNHQSTTVAEKFFHSNAHFPQYRNQTPPSCHTALWRHLYSTMTVHKRASKRRLPPPHPRRSTKPVHTVAGYARASSKLTPGEPLTSQSTMSSSWYAASSSSASPVRQATAAAHSEAVGAVIGGGRGEGAGERAGVRGESPLWPSPAASASLFSSSGGAPRKTKYVNRAFLCSLLNTEVKRRPVADACSAAAMHKRGWENETHGCASRFAMKKHAVLALFIMQFVCWKFQRGHIKPSQRYENYGMCDMCVTPFFNRAFLTPATLYPLL